LRARWRNDFVVPDRNRPRAFRGPQLFQTLLHDAYRLPHLLHAHEITVVAVAVLADRDVEIEFRVTFVGLRLAQIPRGAAAAHQTGAKRPGPRVWKRVCADAAVGVLEDAVGCSEPLAIVACLEERVAECPDVVEELRRQILVHASDTEIVRVHARARGSLVE